MSADNSITLFARSTPAYQVSPTSIAVQGVGKWVLSQSGLHCNLPFQATLCGDDFSCLVCQPTEGQYTVNQITVNHDKKTLQVRAGVLPTTFLPWTDIGYAQNQSPQFSAITVQGQLALQVEDVIQTVDTSTLDVTCGGNSLINLAPGLSLQNTVQVKATCTGRSKMMLNIQCQQLDAVVWGSSLLNGALVTDSANLLARGVSTIELRSYPNAVINSQSTGKSSINIGLQSQVA